MTVLFEAKFENLDLSEFLGSLPDGRDEGDINLTCGKVTPLIHEGKHCIKCEVFPSECIGNQVPRAQVSWLGGRYHKPTELWVKTAYYFPLDYKLSSSGWDFLFDFHHNPDGVYLNLKKVYIKQNSDGTLSSMIANQGRKGLIPKGRWVTFICHYKLGVSDGIIEVWQDGKKLWDLHNIDTASTSGIVASEIDESGFKVYTSTEEPDGLTKYVTDIAISTEPFEEELVPPLEKENNRFLLPLLALLVIAALVLISSFKE